VVLTAPALLLRRYVPKGTDQLAAVAAELNDRPRKILGCPARRMAAGLHRPRLRHHRWALPASGCPAARMRHMADLPRQSPQPPETPQIQFTPVGRARELVITELWRVIGAIAEGNTTLAAAIQTWPANTGTLVTESSCTALNRADKADQKKEITPYWPTSSIWPPSTRLAHAWPPDRSRRSTRWSADLRNATSRLLGFRSRQPRTGVRIVWFATCTHSSDPPLRFSFIAHDKLLVIRVCDLNEGAPRLGFRFGHWHAFFVKVGV
jgi:hypothetical protein